MMLAPMQDHAHSVTIRAGGLSSISDAILLEDVSNLVERNRLDGVAASGDGCRLEYRIVDRFFGRLDDALEEGGHLLVPELFGRQASGVERAADLETRGECDDVVPR